MKKYFLRIELIFLLISVVFVPLVASESKSKILENAAEILMQDISKVISDSEAVIIEEFEGDQQDLFRTHLTSKIIKTNSFKISDKENLKKIFNELVSQNDPAYSKTESPQMGNFRPTNWILFGKVRFSNKTNYGKLKHKLSINYQLDNIENGTIAAEDLIEIEITHKISAISLFSILAGFLVLLYVINVFTKGYLSNWLIGFSIILVIIFTYWHFLV